MSGSASLVKSPNVDDWITFDNEGRITVRSGKVDIGQRISTAIALIAAEELDIDHERIDVMPAETGVSPDEGYSSGSNSMEESGTAVRLAAATARRRLLVLAAEILEVDPATIEVADGIVRSFEANRSTTYWELAGRGLPGLAVDPQVTVTSPKVYRQIGQPVIARGMAELVGGTACFVHDMTMPGMLHARVVRPPHYHARLTHLHDSINERIDGVELVQNGSFLAVAAEDEYRAVASATRVASAASWAPERGLQVCDVFTRLTENPRLSLPVIDGAPREQPVEELGSPPVAAVITLEGRFERPYQMHASLGPSAALAHFENDHLSVWTHSQGIYPLRATLAEALGMPEEAVRLVHAPGAGCYGHNGADDAALDAALVARALPDRPVLLKWSRGDEHAWEPYGSCMAVCARASLDAGGRIVQWSHDGYSDTHINRPRQTPDGGGPRRLIACRHLAEPVEPWLPQPNMGHHAGIHRNADPYYEISRRRIVKHLVRDLPLHTSTLRTLGACTNVFAIESLMDMLAEAAGSEPVAFRLRHLQDRRASAVIRAAAQGLGFRSGTRPEGIGHGLGFARYKNTKTYAAIAVEVQVDDGANTRLRRAVVAADAGQAVDPDGLRAQLEGGALQAASWALYEQVTWDEGGITSRDWDSYPILRFDNVPEMETVIMDRPGEPFLGAGEALGGPTVAAIANAIADSTGLRLMRMPFTPDAIRAAAMA